jgi:hypothetical protein
MSFIHVSSLAGHGRQLEQWLTILVPAMFAIWFCTIFVATRLTRDFKQKDFWKAALRGCPAWMRYGVWTVAGYAWLGMMLMFFLSREKMNTQGGPPPMMSAVLMTFYVIAFAINYSALHVNEVDSSRRCLNGHVVHPLAKFCEECGAAVTEQNVY